MWSPHHLHGVLDMTPLPCFLDIALGLAILCIVRGFAVRPCFSIIWRAIVWICISDIMSLSQGSTSPRRSVPIVAACS
jgi:hypothetical protein